MMFSQQTTFETEQNELELKDQKPNLKLILEQQAMIIVSVLCAVYCLGMTITLGIFAFNE